MNKEWNPPNIPLSCLDNPAEFRDLNGRKFVNSRRGIIYKFPWYLSYLYLWHGLKHWYTTGKWPERILYFSNNQKRDRDLFLEIIERPQDYYSCDTGWAVDEGEELDELFEEFEAEDNA